MKKICPFLGLSLICTILLVSISRSQASIDALPAQQMDKPTLVQSNHYFSTKQKSINYNVISLNKNLPVIIIPKNQHAERKAYTNKVNLTLNDNKGHYINCLLDDNYELCVLETFQTDALSLIIQCETLPCEFSWTVVQVPIQKIQTKNLAKTSLKELYEIKQSIQNKHLTIKATCKSAQLQQGFHKSLQFYANRQNYKKIKAQSITYYLFSNPPTSFKQYFYLKIDQKYRSCAEIQIFNQQNEILKDTVVTDFVLTNTNVTYNLKQSAKDMRLDVNLHVFTDQMVKQQQTVDGYINIRLLGTVGGSISIIRKMSLHFTKQSYIDLSFALNNIPSDHTNLQLQFQSVKIDSIVDLMLAQGEVQQVQTGQYCFFSLKKGQKVKYQLVQQKQADSNQKTFIFASEATKVKASKTQCNSQSGCNFQVQALEDFDGSVYLGQSKKQNTEEIVTFDIKKSFTKRVHEDTFVYLKKAVEQKKSYQIVVNTHNVMMYAANEQKCKGPNQKCHQKIGNSHHPFIYQSDKKGNLIIGVHSLDETEFTVTIIQQNGEYPELKDGVPFTYLMDGGEQDVIFSFTVPQKQDLSFTLVSPLNQLVLYMFNSDKLPQKDYTKSQLFTLDGYIYIEKSQIKSKQFIVVVRKLDPSTSQFIHFTLIASTKNANIKLEAGVTHHQKLVAKQHQDFVLQFNTKNKYVVSFYVHNQKGNPINLQLDLSSNDQYDEQKNSKKDTGFVIDREVDEIDISQQGSKVCKRQGSDSCEVFLRIKNNMGKDIDMQLTLLTTNSIVQLHDGIWQYFPEQLTSTTTNFYFFPKHTNNPISIIYHSNNPDLRILYSLIKMDTDKINPSMWQFPHSDRKQSLSSLENLNLGQRQVKHVSIGRYALKSCSPDCLLLVTLVKADKVKGQFNQVVRDQQFGILVSNNIIDIPQKTKVQVILSPKEQRYLKMSMKTVLQHSTLTCYVYTTLGSASIYANVCSQKNLRMPSASQFDFSFGVLQTQLKAKTIQNKLKQNDIQDGQNPYLCMIAVSEQNSKISIQYTSEQDIVSLLNLDQFKTIQIEKGSPQYFQVEASVQHTIKIVRNKGFPFVQEKKCNGKDTTYDQCLEQLKTQNEEDKKYQLVQKVKRYQYEPCEKCIVYIKISSEQPAEIDIHLESKYTQITLQEKKIVTDYLQKNEQNRYELTALSNQPTYVNINVIDGDIKVNVSDLASINIVKSSDAKQKVIQFAIKPSQHIESKKGSSLLSKDTSDVTTSIFSSFQSLFSGFGLEKTFTTLHISVSSIDPQKGASYTIQYSSGERQSYLQDGLVYRYNIQGNSPKATSKFYYQNLVESNHVYIFLGTKKSSQLSKLQINIYQMQGQQDMQNKQQINSKIPEMRKKTVKPTVLYPLPTAKFYAIQVMNPTGTQIQLSVGVNHQQILFLPYEIDYPFPLSNQQKVNFIIDVQNKGYILLTLKKCDQTNAELSYTFDYDGFNQGEFQHSTTLNNQPKFQYLIKTKQAGPLYVNIKRSETEGISSDAEFKNSVFSLNAKFSQSKMKTSDFIKPGNKGIMSYEIISNDKIRIEFTSVTCQLRNEFCGQKFQYYLVASDKMVDVYSQSVCPSTYFAEVQNSDKHPVLPLRKILQKPNSQNKITFEYQFEKSNAISYVAIKAIYKNKQDETVEVFYQPIQVVTIWGQLQKASSNKGIKFAVVFMFLFCLLIICIRRQKRKGYQTLEEHD